MNFVISTIGGGEFLYDILNGIILTINSPAYKTIIHGIMLIGLLFHIFKTSTVGTYGEAIKWFFLCYFVFSLAIIPKATVIIEDRLNNGVPNIINNVPIGLAFPASFISNLDATMAEMFDTNFTPVGDISYTNAGMLFGNSVIDAITKADLTSDIENNFKEFVRQCVYDQILLGNILKERLKESGNLNAIILDEANHSNIFHVNYTTSTGSQIISCKAAAGKIKSDLDNTTNKVALKIAGILNPSLYKYNSTTALNKTDMQIADVNTYLLNSAKDSLETIRQGMIIQGFIDGMDKRMSLASSDNPYARVKAKLTQRESWKVIGANAPTYVVILKIFIQVLLYALFPIVIVMIMAGIFGFSILIEYFKALFALALISPMFAILNRISYGFTSYKLSALITENPSPVEHGINLGNILKIQEFNADIMAFSGYLSIMLVPMAFTITQRGFSAMGNIIGGAMQGTAVSNASTTANEVISGNYSLANTSIGNDNLYNSSKYNINEDNRSIGNDSLHNSTINAKVKNTISENVTSRNIHNANKSDLSSVTVKGGTDTYTVKGTGTVTFGSDNKLASMQEEGTHLENSISKSQGIVNSETGKREYGYQGNVGFNIGNNGGRNNLKGNFEESEQSESKNIIMKGIDKIANMAGISAGANAYITENASREHSSSSSTSLTNDQIYTQKTLDHLNSKYDKEYMKNHIDEVFKEANEFQRSLSGTKEVEAPTTGIDYIKSKLKK